MRRACRKDAAHDELIMWHRNLGWAVLETYQLAQGQPGFPDFIAWHPVSGAVVFVEVKDEKAKLTEAEQKWRLCWPGHYEIERTVTDVLSNHKKYMAGGD